MKRQLEGVMLTRGLASPSKRRAGLCHNQESVGSRKISGIDTLLDLQRTHGNAFVQRLVQLKPLAVSQPGDKCEHEAGRVADAVVRRKDASNSIPTISRYAKPRVQRMCAECEGEMERQAETRNAEEEEKLQRQAAPGGATSTSGETENAIRALQGGGQPLPEPVRADIEPRMGYDLSGVRIHTHGHAAQLARSVNALAFTVGRDIVFGAGEYRPETRVGKRLLAHELTYVVQQTGSEHISTRLLRGLLTERTFGQDVWPVTRRRHTEARSRLNVGPLVQRESLGTRGEAMGTHIARPGDSPSLIAGYPSDGWRERLDQLIAANQELPSIKNRTPDDPQYGWLEVGDVINVPWLPPSDRLPGTGKARLKSPSRNHHRLRRRSPRTQERRKTSVFPSWSPNLIEASTRPPDQIRWSFRRGKPIRDGSL